MIEVKDLRYSYPDGTSGLNGVSFRIMHGESVAIVGENGAGKSTLLLHLNGILNPSGGEVRIGGDAVIQGNVMEIRRRVGMVFQNPDDQLFMPTVFDDVAFGPLNMGLSAAEAEVRADQALGAVGALHLRMRPPYKLSQGEKRSVSIATVIAMSPDILVMDEPTSSLDPVSRRRLIDILKTFRHTKIIATHDLDMAMDLCDRTIVLQGGRVIADGLTREVLRDESVLNYGRLEKPLSMQRPPWLDAHTGHSSGEEHRHDS